MVGAKIEVQSMILVFEVDPNKSLPLNNIVFFFFKKKVNVFLNIANMIH